MSSPAISIRPALAHRVSPTLHSLARPLLLMAAAASAAALITFASTSTSHRKLAYRLTASEIALSQSTARVKFLESLLRRSAAESRPLSEMQAQSGTANVGVAVATPIQPSPANPLPAQPTPVAARAVTPSVAVMAQKAPAAANGGNGANGSARASTVANNAKLPASMVTTVRVVAGDAKADARPADTPRSTPSPSMASADTAKDSLKAASAIAPSTPSAEQIAQARKQNPTEVVSYQQLGLQSLQPRQAILKDGRLISVGEVFPSGDRLLAIDPDNKQLVTDRRTIILF